MSDNIIIGKDAGAKIFRGPIFDGTLPDMGFETLPTRFDLSALSELSETERLEKMLGLLCHINVHINYLQYTLSAMVRGMTKEPIHGKESKDSPERE